MKEFFVDDIKAKQYKQRSLVAFIVFFVMMGAAYAGWKWLGNQPLDGGLTGGIQQPLRAGLEINESFFKGIYSKKRTVKEYKRSQAAPVPRVNGYVGLDEDFFDAGQWKLQVIKATGDTLFITLDEIKKLPKVDVVFNFKCIEGWSQVTWWSGVRFSDFAAKYGLTKETGMKYVSMITPDEEYYVGIDMESMQQPQTILCYEMNARPLPMNQGYPLRLIIPVKYGVKHIKRIGTISFANNKPKDYWAERGYDYYTGH